jgi:exodeoxyribonuclease VII small subunit
LIPSNRRARPVFLRISLDETLKRVFHAEISGLKALKLEVMAKTTEKAPDAKAQLALDEARPESFEKAMAELDEIIDQMESGELPLEESLTSYKRGAVLIEYCRGSLAKIEQQVKVLEADLLKPYE